MRHLTILTAITLLMWVSGCDDDKDSQEMTPAGDTPAGDTPAGDTPAGDTPAGDTPAGDTPAGDTPAGDTPAGDTPAGDTPAGDTPAGDTPAGDTPAGDTPAGETPAGETPEDEISAETIVNVSNTLFNAIAETFVNYCAVCDEIAETEECNDELREELSLSAAECIVSESTPEQLASVIASFECEIDAFNEFKSCLDMLTECDPEGANQCAFIIEMATMSCMEIDTEYEQYIGEVCFDETPEENYTCADGEVIEGDASCDGYIDCTDLSDERGCGIIWVCEDENGEYESDQLCDGVEQCADGSDESYCP